ncbi:uncharacterized protein LOC143240921 [Tachypleus tridentatus]|uniref:uncharacterized protein LOC143240921 n=1 Tax=Tachypleus tridentatus TaxID=6853 RepID=UPI003FD0F06E
MLCALALLYCFSVILSQSCIPAPASINVVCECSHLNDSIKCFGSAENSTLIFAYITSILKSVNAKEIVIDVNGVDIVPPRFFETCSLNLISIITNTISFLPQDTFFGVNTSLKLLSLRQNHFVSVPSTALKNLRHLLELDLSNNFIASIESNDFVEMPKLFVLILSHNELKIIERGAFQSLSLLQELYLEYNMLSDLHQDMFLGLTRLGFLSLSANRLQIISANVFTHLKSIEYIEMDHNCLSLMENVKIESSSVLMITMQNNSLGGQLDEGSFRGVPNLLLLNLGYNNLETLATNSLSKLSELQELYLNNNNIKIILDHAFSKLWNLRTLQLENNEIRNLPFTAFSNLTSLRNLTLKNNLLVKLTCEHTADLLRLVRVNLNDNHLNNISAGTFSYSLNLKEISVKGNSFVCDCSIKEFVLILKKKLQADGSEQCAGPSSLLGKYLTEVDYGAMTCAKTSVICQSPALNTRRLSDDVNQSPENTTGTGTNNYMDTTNINTYTNNSTFSMDSTKSRINVDSVHSSRIANVTNSHMDTTRPSSYMGTTNTSTSYYEMYSPEITATSTVLKTVSVIPLEVFNITSFARAHDSFDYNFFTSIQETKYSSLLIAWDLYQHEPPNVCRLRLTVSTDSEVILDKSGINCSDGTYTMKGLREGKHYNICIITIHLMWPDQENCTTFHTNGTQTALESTGNPFSVPIITGVVVLIILIIIILVIVLIIIFRRRRISKENENYSIKIGRHSGSYNVNETSKI